MSFSINSNITRLPSSVIAEAVDQFSTPFYLYEESRIRHNCQLFTKAFSPLFPEFTPLFAFKANPNPEVIKIIIDEGFQIDASSPFEVEMSRKLGISGMYTASYTPVHELQFAKDNDFFINLDDISFVPLLEKIGVPEFASFRINPGISKGGMKSLHFAGKDAKFGMPFEKAIEAYAQLKAIGVKKFGMHMMTGSNVLEEDYFSTITEKLLDIMGQVHRELDIEFEYINLGGGFGVPYRSEEKSLDIACVAKNIREIFDNKITEYGFKEPKLMIEPGRAITADAGFFIVKATSNKSSYRHFVGVDSGMNAFPRPSVYDAYHHVSLLGKENDSPSEKVSIVGTLCENNDQFAKERNLPPINSGDIIVFHNAGAHCYAMAHNYNGRLRPAEYLHRNDESFQLIRREETIEDLQQCLV